MAIARCDKHTPDGTKHAYKALALLLGYPETADSARRDRTACGENGLIGEEDACCVIVDGTAVQ